MPPATLVTAGGPLGRAKNAFRDDGLVFPLTFLGIAITTTVTGIFLGFSRPNGAYPGSQAGSHQRSA